MEFGRFLWQKEDTVYAFEPNPKPYKFLAENALPNIQVYNVALGDKESEAKLKLHKYSGRDSLVIKGKSFTGETIKD